MKKLLSALTAIGLTTTSIATTTNVVSCGEPVPTKFTGIYAYHVYTMEQVANKLQKLYDLYPGLEMKADEYGLTVPIDFSEVPKEKLSIVKTLYNQLVFDYILYEMEFLINNGQLFKYDQKANGKIDVTYFTPIYNGKEAEDTISSYFNIIRIATAAFSFFQMEENKGLWNEKQINKSVELMDAFKKDFFKNIYVKPNDAVDIIKEYLETNNMDRLYDLSIKSYDIQAFVQDETGARALSMFNFDFFPTSFGVGNMFAPVFGDIKDGDQISQEDLKEEIHDLYLGDYMQGYVMEQYVKDGTLVPIFPSIESLYETYENMGLSKRQAADALTQGAEIQRQMLKDIYGEDYLQDAKDYVEQLIIDSQKDEY